MCEICSKLIIKTPERRHCSALSIVEFEQVNTSQGISSNSNTRNVREIPVPGACLGPYQISSIESFSGNS